MLMVWPLTQSAMTADSRAMGIVMTTISELRQSRRNTRTINPVRNAPSSPSTDEPREGAHDVPRLVEHEVDLDVFRGDAAHGRQGLPDAANHVERGRVGALRHRNVDRPFAVHVRVADDDVGRVGDGADVAEVDRRTVRRSQRSIEQFLDIAAERRVRRRNPNQVTRANVARWDHACSSD